MALWSDPRFSDSEKLEKRPVKDPFDNNGIGPAFLMFAGAAFGIALLGVVIGLGHPEQPTTLADRSLDRPTQAQPARPVPSAPNHQ